MNATRRNCLLAAATAILVGCASAPAPKAPAGITIIGSEAFASSIEVDPIRTELTETGTTRAWVGVRNRSKAKIMIEGRSNFTGSGGRPVESAGAWQALFIEPGAHGTVQFLSMSSAANNVAIDIREGNR